MRVENEAKLAAEKEAERIAELERLEKERIEQEAFVTAMK